MASNPSLRPATANDLDLLARMNRRLIEDEESANLMELEELRERMQGWLGSTYDAVFFEQDGEVVGYTLYRFENETFRERRVVYVRQFFIDRAYRRRGLGCRAFEELRQHFFGNALLRLEVLTTNPSGLAFWRSLGFRTYAVTLGLE